MFPLAATILPRESFQFFVLDSEILVLERQRICRSTVLSILCIGFRVSIYASASCHVALFQFFVLDSKADKEVKEVVIERFNFQFFVLDSQSQ